MTQYYDVVFSRKNELFVTGRDGVNVHYFEKWTFLESPLDSGSKNRNDGQLPWVISVEGADVFQVPAVRLWVFREYGALVYRFEDHFRLTFVAATREQVFWVANGNLLRSYKPDGSLVREWGVKQFGWVAGLAVCGDLLYVVDTVRHCVQVFELDGTPVRTWGTKGKAQGQFHFPCGVAVSPEGEICVVDGAFSRVQAFGPDGSFLREQYFHECFTGIASSQYGVFVVSCAKRMVTLF